MLETEQITSLCRRAFGQAVEIESIEELAGGTFNSAYRIVLRDQSRVMLRVAPPQTAQLAWEDAFLMRSEHAMQPYFAPVASLMPRTLLVDFTHQLIDRDYMFQTYIEGERWDDAWDELTPAENDALWSQFGTLMRQIHDVQGQTFGLPRTGFQFERWSEAVIDRMTRTLHAAKDLQLDIIDFTQILAIIRAHPEQLDEIRIPRLLHGDLWLFNLLISHRAEGPSIVGVLDADRSWWGDPMADWTMFILAQAEANPGHASFWQSYGQPAATRSATFRKTVYDGMHAGTALVWSTQHDDPETVQKALGTLREVAAALPAFL